MAWRLAGVIFVPCALWFSAQGPTLAAAPSCKTAGEAYEQSLADFSAVIAGRPPRAVDPSSEEGDGPSPQQNLTQAETKLEAASGAAGKDSLDAAFALLDVAVAQRNLAHYGEATASIRRALAIVEKSDAGSELQAGLYRERGIVLSRMRKRLEAFVDFDRAIAIYESAGSAGKAALTYRTKADILRGLNRFSDALVSLGRARAVYEKSRPARAIDLAEVMTDISIIHSRLNDRTSALALAQQAADIAQEAQGPANRTAARALHNVAIGLRRLERWDEALAAFAKAYAIYVTPGPASAIRAAEVLEDTGVTYSRIGCFEQAIAAETAALKSYQAFYGGDHDRVAAAQHRLGTLLRDAGQATEALQSFTAAAAMYDTLLGPDNPRSAKVFIDIANLHSVQGHGDEASAFGIRTVRILGSSGGPDDLRDALWAMARILKAQGNSGGAILFAKKAVNQQQEIRAANRELPAELAKSLAERYRELYMYLADLLIEDGRLEEAQFTLDLIKQQELIDFVRGGRAEPTSVDSRAALTKTERKTSDSIDALLLKPIGVSKELAKLLAGAKGQSLSEGEKLRMAELKRRFNDNYKTYQAQVKALIDGMKTESAAAQSEVVKLHLDMLGQTRKRLKQFKGRAVILQIASLDKDVHVFLTTTNAQVHHSERVPRVKMARLAFEAWHAAAQQEEDASAKLKALYDILIRPVESELKASGAEVIMLNLEGFLRYIPFAALSAGDHYLIEDFALTLQTPAAETVYAKGERDRTRAAGFGVTEAIGDFSGLPGVARELEAIFDGGDSAGIFAGIPEMNSDFTADTFATALEAKPLFVHIASHFKLTPGDESGSFLLLGNGEKLSLESIRTDSRFQFTDVDLLTLSACETAGEVGNDGKEVESFATLAQGSGASSVLATLWPIADESTARLMSDFYGGLLSDGLDKATALRRAQIAMIRNEAATAVAMNVPRGVNPTDDGGTGEEPPPVPFSHPYHWSAFILMGNWL